MASQCTGKQTRSIFLSLKKEERNKGDIKYFGAKERLISSFMHMQGRHGDIKDPTLVGAHNVFTQSGVEQRNYLK